MSKLLSSNDVSLSFSCSLGDNALVVDSMDGTEGISRPYVFSVIAHSLNKEIPCQALLGTDATVLLMLDGQTRYFSGIIGGIDQMETREGRDGLLYLFYELQIRPKLWLLTFTKDYRIFQNQHAIDIITTILHENGVTQIDSHVSNMNKKTREFCVQYEESCFDFVSRLMEEEGISYTFKHSKNQHTMILMDSTHAAEGAHQTLPMSQAVLSDEPAMNQITYLRRQHNVVPSQYKAADYNYMKPSMPLRSTVKGEGVGGIMCEYPAHFADLHTGEILASRRINELEWPKNIVSGKSTAPLLGSSSLFTLSKHPSLDANRTYFVYEITHQITRLPTYDVSNESQLNNKHTQGRMNFIHNPQNSPLFLNIYDNSFSAIPNDVIFTPTRTTKKPKIHSNQTAVVVGPVGEEVYCDNLGRVKIQFHWDTRGTFDTNSSCWVRVSQNWAGSGWGGLVIPRIGMEVIVTFTDGDPDRPLITGCVYNAEKNPPHSVTHNPTKSLFKTNSTRKKDCYNELSIDDAVGAEEIHIKAAKDMNMLVGDNYSLSLTSGDATTTLAAGNMNTTLNQGNKTLTLTAGNYTIQLTQGCITIEAAGDVSISSGGALNLSGTSINLNAQNNIKIGALSTVSITGGALVSVDFPGKMPTFPM